MNISARLEKQEFVIKKNSSIIFLTIDYYSQSNYMQRKIC